MPRYAAAEHPCPPRDREIGTASFSSDRRAPTAKVMNTATTTWVDLCYEALGVPASLPEEDRRVLAEHVLLDRTDQEVDMLSIGAARAAIDLLVRHGAAGDLDGVMLLWEQESYLPDEIVALGDEGTLRATVCAKRLLHDVVSFTERGRRS